MKRILILVFTILTIFSCSKDDDENVLATPTLEWGATSIQGNNLEISITISSSEDLPAGTLEFKVDGKTINTFSATKGSNAYTTDYTVDDKKAHQALLVYSFADGRTELSKTITIKKSVQETLQRSSRNDWIEI